MYVPPPEERSKKQFSLPVSSHLYLPSCFQFRVSRPFGRNEKFEFFSPSPWKYPYLFLLFSISGVCQRFLIFPAFFDPARAVGCSYRQGNQMTIMNLTDRNGNGAGTLRTPLAELSVTLRAKIQRELFFAQRYFRYCGQGIEPEYFIIENRWIWFVLSLVLTLELM